jgi:hypothetical protein
MLHEGKIQVVSATSVVDGQELVWAMMVAWPGFVSLSLHLPVKSRITDAACERAMAKIADRIVSLWLPKFVPLMAGDEENSEHAILLSPSWLLTERKEMRFTRDSAQIMHHFPAAGGWPFGRRALARRLSETFRKDWGSWVKLVFGALRIWVNGGCVEKTAGHAAARFIREQWAAKR